MRRLIRNLINKILSPSGLSLERRYEVNYLKVKYNEVLKELHDSFQDVILPGFPDNKKRIELLSKLYGTQVSEALYIILYLHKSLELKGDVCEFGVANGATSTLLANEIKKSKKALWLFDSFEGLSKPTSEDILLDDIFKLGSMKEYEGTMQYNESEVISRLQSIAYPQSRISLVKGFINEVVLKKRMPQKVCFAYVDFDLYEPIKVTLQFLRTHLSTDGYIIVDDYGYFSKGVKTAVDEFVREHKQQFTINFPYTFAGHFCILQKRGS